jgi:transcriptional regulator with XRE-family HTH domain
MHGRDRLKAWIERAHLSQRQAAHLFGMHYTFLNQILSGKKAPGLANAVAIERETGIAAKAWMPTTDGKSSAAIASRARKRRVA